MSTSFTTADHVDRHQLHDAMCDAFSDYDIPLQPSFEQFNDMLDHRHFVPELSAIAIENDQVIAFWAIAQRGKRGHLAMSGTRPNSRGKGLAKQLSKTSNRLMKGAGITSLQFEVLTTNTRAKSLYEKLGNLPKREFDCYRFAAPNHHPDNQFEFSPSDWQDIREEVALFKQFEPSWQAADEAIQIAGPKIICLTAQKENNVIGFLAATATGAIFQLAVDPNHRRQSIATQLLSTFATAHSLEQFSYTNVDSNDQNTKALMNKLDATIVARQFEMFKKL